MMFDKPENASLLFYLLFGGALLVSRIPYVGKYLRVVHTLVHEAGHGIAAMLTSGELQSIELFANTEGKATTSSSSKTGRFLQAIAGYPVASITAYLFFYYIHIDRPVLPLIIILAIGLICLVLFIRNLYGVFWLVTFCALLLYIIYRDVAMEAYIASVLISSLILIDSVIYPVYLLVIAAREPGKAGDAKNLKDITHIPAIIWALFFVAFSGYIAFYTFKFFPLFDLI
jgi:hypothetical protein